MSVQWAGFTSTEHMKMSLREVKDSINPQGEGSRGGSLHNLDQYDGWHLKVFMTETNASVSVKPWLYAAVLGGRAELPSKAENYDPRGPHQLAP